MKPIRGQTSAVYRQTNVERPLGDTRPFWVTETIENRWSDTGKTRRVVAGFPKACGGSSGTSESLGRGADARESLPG